MKKIILFIMFWFVGFVLLYVVADTPMFGYGYNTPVHVLNGRDFIPTPTIFGWGLSLMFSFILTSLTIWINRKIRKPAGMIMK